MEIKKWQIYLWSGEDWEHFIPPTSLLPAGSLHKMHIVWSSDCKTVSIPSDIFCISHLQNLVHVYAGLRHCLRLEKKKKIFRLKTIKFEQF